MLVHTHNIYQDQTIMLLIGGIYCSIFFYATTVISTTTGGICGGIPIDFYSDIGGIDQLCSPISFVCLCLYTLLCIHYICHASARLPAFQSTAPHFPSSLDGMRNRKAQNGSRSSECGNRTPPSKSDTVPFSHGKASANQRLSRH